MVGNVHEKVFAVKQFDPFRTYRRTNSFNVNQFLKKDKIEQHDLDLVHLLIFTINKQ